MKEIILINGPSSSGKSSVAKVLNILYNHEYEIVSIDDYLQMDTINQVLEENVYDATIEMVKKINELLSEGKKIIIDHVITSKRIYEMVINAFNKEYLIIKLDGSLNVLEANEKKRNNRCIGSAKASKECLYTEKADIMITIDNKTIYEIASIIYDNNHQINHKKQKKIKRTIDYKTGEDIDMLNDMKYQNTCDNHWDGA